MLTEHEAERDLSALLAEHDRLQAIWRASDAEDDRRAMAAAWSVAITAPGSRFDDTVDVGGPCRPTVLTCHWLPQPNENYWTMRDHLGYRGACLGCGWVCAVPRRSRGAENLAVEDAHNHSHPGWRELPVVGAPPSLEAPASYPRLVEKWRSRWGHLLPDGWLESGGPIRTHRPPPGSRHVPGRAPGGGYDLAARDLAANGTGHEEPGGQLTFM